MTYADCNLARNSMVLAITIIVHLALLYALSRIRSARLNEIDEFRGAWIVIDSVPPSADKPMNRSKFQSIAQLATEINSLEITIDDLPSDVGIEPPRVDWRTQGAKAVDKIVTRHAGEEQRQGSSTLHQPQANVPIFLPPVHKKGDSEHFDDGEIATWIDGRCYATNKDFGEQRANANTLVVVCKGNVGKAPIRGDMFDHLKPGYLQNTVPHSDSLHSVEKPAQQNP